MKKYSDLQDVIMTLNWISNHPAAWEWSKIIDESLIPKLLQHKEELESEARNT